MAKQRDRAIASNREFKELTGSMQPSRQHAPEYDPDPRGVTAKAFEESSRVPVDAYELVD